jgi:hypothetical protein
VVTLAADVAVEVDVEVDVEVEVNGGEVDSVPGGDAGSSIRLKPIGWASSRPFQAEAV